jgi:hypothetical protein
VPGDLNTTSKRFGGNFVPGGEIRKRKDGYSKGYPDHKGQDDVEVAMDPTAKLLYHHGTPQSLPSFSGKGVGYDLKVTILSSVLD